MQIEKVAIIPATVVHTQDTIMENIRETIQEHETRSKEDHVRRLTVQIAYHHFIHAISV